VKGILGGYTEIALHQKMDLYNVFFLGFSVSLFLVCLFVCLFVYFLLSICNLLT